MRKSLLLILVLMAGAVVGQVLGVLVYLGRMLKEGFSAFRNFKLSDLFSLAKEHSFFPRFSMFHKMINNFSSSLPIFVFSLYFSAAEVGYFGFGFMLINRPMNLLSTSFSKVFSQKSYIKVNPETKSMICFRFYVTN